MCSANTDAVGYSPTLACVQYNNEQQQYSGGLHTLTGHSVRMHRPPVGATIALLTQPAGC